MSKTVGIILSLRDKFTTPLHKVNDKLGTTKNKLKQASKSIQKFTNAIKAGMKTVVKWSAIGFGALMAGASLFIKQSIDGAKEKLKADKLLETNLMKQAKFSKEHIQILKDEASALQDIGVVGDDVAVAGASRLAVFKMNADQIKKTMPILDDMIAYDKGLNGTQEDAIGIAELYGKAINGKVNALKKYGVVLTANEEKLFKVMSAEQRIEFINKKLEKSIGGTNKALRETDEGKIVAMKGAFGDMQAELGKKLIPKLANLAEWFHSKIPAIQDYILRLADKFEEMYNNAKPYIVKVKELLGKIFEKLKPALTEVWNILTKVGAFAIDLANKIIDNWNWIAPIVTGVAVAFGIYKTAVMIASAKTLLFNGIMVVTNFLLNANPIGLVVLSIGALAGALVAIYKNWDKFKAKVQELWNKLDNNPLGKVLKFIIKFCNPIGVMINLFIWLKNVITENWISIKTFGEYLWNGLAGALVAIYKNWDKFKAKVQELWNKLDNNPLGKVLKFIIKFCNPIGVMINLFIWLKNVITENWISIKTFGEYLWNGLAGAFNYVKDVILGVCKVVGGIFTAIWDGVIDALSVLKDTFFKVSDFITGVFMSAWDTLMKALDVILHPIETAKKSFEGLIDKLKFWNNTKAEDKTININEVKKTDNIGGSNKTGISTSTVKNPRHALGTAYFKGGVTGINEGGRNETAILPAGTQILSHEQGKSLNNNKSISVTINIDGNFIGEREQMEKYGEYITNKILGTLGNM